MALHHTLKFRALSGKDWRTTALSLWVMTCVLAWCSSSLRRRSANGTICVHSGAEACIRGARSRRSLNLRQEDEGAVSSVNFTGGAETGPSGTRGNHSDLPDWPGSTAASQRNSDRLRQMDGNSSPAQSPPALRLEGPAGGRAHQQ